MIHDFSNYSLKKLYGLRGDLLKTLDNPKNQPVNEPVWHTIEQIDAELTKRGYSKIREQIKIMP